MGTPEAKSLAEALTQSHGLFPQQKVVKMILPPITAESPRNNNAIQEMRNEMKHHEKLLRIFYMWLGSLSSNRLRLSARACPHAGLSPPQTQSPDCKERLEKEEQVDETGL